jgi:hypothetical protein
MMIVMIGSDIEQSDDEISAIKPINIRKSEEALTDFVRRMRLSSFQMKNPNKKLFLPVMKKVPTN